MKGGILLKIRQEQRSDYAEVYELVKVSFSTSSYSDGTEADYLNEIRKKETFIPELSLIAEDENEKIVGQIVLYQTNITMPDKTITELVLSPICVHPDYFHRGIARALIQQALSIARRIGYHAVFLCGEPELYRKLGFIPSFEYGIFHISDLKRNAQWCMACELSIGALAGVTGTIDIL